MPTHYLLVDYENVKRVNPTLLASGDHHVILFLGPQEDKLPVELVLAMERLGPRGQYVRLRTRGPNALDFLLCHHLGTLMTRAPRARFHVLSRDTGFDPLLAHLRAQGYHCARVATLEELPGAKPPGAVRGAIPALPAPPAGCCGEGAGGRDGPGGACGGPAAQIPAQQAGQRHHPARHPA